MKKLIGVLVIMVPWGAFCQTAPIVRLTDVLALMESKSDRVEVINFWATWCGPCVKELPNFEKLNLDSSHVHVTLVSMDLDLDPNPEKVYSFVRNKKIKADVMILNEPDPNSWIDKISTAWSGALPATLIVNPKTGKRKFVEKEVSESDLRNLIFETK